MKKTVKIVFGIVLAIFMLTSHAQSGQRQRPKPPSPEEILEKATEELDLTDEQVEAWKGIHETYADEMKDSPRKTMPKVEAEIKEILTEEQWGKFEEMKPKKGPRSRGGN